MNALKTLVYEVFLETFYEKIKNVLIDIEIFLKW